jgi:hypothetical protein
MLSRFAGRLIMNEPHFPDFKRFQKSEILRAAQMTAVERTACRLQRKSLIRFTQ